MNSYKGGSMKKLMLLLHIMVLTGHVYTQKSLRAPEYTSPRYKNKITGVFYSVYEDVHQLKLEFDQDPIAFYDPVNYEESQKQDYRRYFLPRTHLAHRKIQHAIKHINENEHAGSFYFEIDRVRGKYHGYDVHVTVNDRFKIEKIVDRPARAVYFKVSLKNEE